MTGAQIRDSTVCAVIVAFYPEIDFETRLLCLLPQVGALVVVDNTPTAERRRRITLSAPFGVHVLVLENEDNLGVATALNQGLSQALQWNCEWLLTMDQDSHCYSDMVQTLLSAEAACIPKPAVIGGNYLNTRNNKPKIKVGKNGDFLDQKTVITSGCLVAARFAKAIGGFRDDYFIDQLDHEFCLRVRVNEGRIVITSKPVMLHSVGNNGGVRLPILGILPNHSPVRKYYIARNTVVTVATYWHSDPVWCIKRVVRLFLGLFEMAILEEHRLRKIHAFVTGITDGLKHRMGVCQRTGLQ